MEKQIIILEKVGGNFTAFRYAMWLDIPATRQSFYANPSASSAYVNASTAEILALRAGSMKEIVDIITVPAGASIGSVQSSLITRFNEEQSEINTTNLWNRYGTFYNGTSWTIGGVS